MSRHHATAHAPRSPHGGSRTMLFRRHKQSTPPQTQIGPDSRPGRRGAHIRVQLNRDTSPARAEGAPACVAQYMRRSSVHYITVLSLSGLRTSAAAASGPYRLAHHCVETGTGSRGYLLSLLICIYPEGGSGWQSGLRQSGRPRRVALRRAEVESYYPCGCRVESSCVCKWRCQLKREN